MSYTLNIYRNSNKNEKYLLKYSSVQIDGTSQKEVSGLGSATSYWVSLIDENQEEVPVNNGENLNDDLSFMTNGDFKVYISSKAVMTLEKVNENASFPKSIYWNLTNNSGNTLYTSNVAFDSPTGDTPSTSLSDYVEKIDSWSTSKGYKFIRIYENSYDTEGIAETEFFSTLDDITEF